MPLVPRDGARVLRGSRDSRADERAVRVHQARPRGAARPRLDLHGGLSGDDGPGRLAAQRLPHPGAGAVLRGHLLPAGLAHGHAELALRARRRGRGLGRAPRRDPRGRQAGGRAAPRRRAARAVRPAARRGRARRGGGGAAPPVRPGAGRLRERAQVPAGLGARVPAAARRDGDDHPHAARHGLGRDVRPGGRQASRATRWTPTGSSPTSRRCSTTTRCSRAPTSTAGRSPASRCSAPSWRRRSTGRFARCEDRRAASTPRSTPTPRAWRAGSTSGAWTSCARRSTASPTRTRRSRGSAPPTAATSRAATSRCAGPASRSAAASGAGGCTTCGPSGSGRGSTTSGSRRGTR